MTRKKMSYQHTQPAQQVTTPWMRYIMWSLPLSFFLYQFVLRLWPSLMMQQIMQQFNIDATNFGFLVSTYYYGYALVQIPLAILLDRYGPRLVLSVCAIACGLATCLFTITDQWVIALLSRFFIGAGSAGGFLATSKVISQWFPKEHYGKMVGFSFSIGLMGAVYGGKPTSLLVNTWGGEPVALVLAFLSLAIGVFAYLFLRSPRCEIMLTEPEKNFLQVSSLKRLILSPSLVLLALANLLMVGALEGFADVWGVNYLMTTYGMNKAASAECTSFIFIGMLFGGPILAFLSKKFGNYQIISSCGVGFTILLSYLILFYTGSEFSFLSTLFFVVGLLCCYQVLIFSIASDFVKPHLLGMAIAFLNCVNMLGGSFFHSLIGFFMDYYWSGNEIEGIRQYSIDSYTHALMVIPICAFIGATLVMIVRSRIQKEKLKTKKMH